MFVEDISKNALAHSPVWKNKKYKFATGKERETDKVQANGEKKKLLLCLVFVVALTE